VHTFCFAAWKTAAHAIEHFLRRRIHMTAAAAVAAQKQIVATSLPIEIKGEPLSFQLRAHFVIRL